MPSKSVQQKHIFCIDDDPQMLRLFEMLLGDMGNIKVHHFTDAYAALAAMHGLKPDLVLLDVMMPEMNGFVAYQEMRTYKALKNVKVLFVTARNRDDDLKQYKALGVPTLTKPFDAVDFQNTISSLL